MLDLLPDVDRSGNCLTNTSVFLNWGTGDMCNGHGSCIDGFCVCDEGWTGRGDIFTLHGYACVYPVALESTLWYVLAFAFTIAVFKAFFILRAEYPKRSQMHNFKMFFTLMTLLGCCLPLIGLGMVRAYLHLNVGVDAAPTALAIVWHTTHQSLQSSNNYLFSKFLVSSNIQNTLIKDGLLRTLYYRGILVGVGLVVLVDAIWLAGVFIPQGPTWPRFALLYLKLASALAWSWETYYMKTLLLKELQKIRAALESTNSGNKASTSTKRLLCVIDGLQDKVKQAKMATCLYAPVLCVFVLVPPLMVLEFVPTTVMFMLSAFVTVSVYEDIPGQSQTSSSEKSNNLSSKNSKGMIPPFRDTSKEEQSKETLGSIVMFESKI